MLLGQILAGFTKTTSSINKFHYTTAAAENKNSEKSTNTSEEVEKSSEDSTHDNSFHSVKSGEEKIMSTTDETANMEKVMKNLNSYASHENNMTMEQFLVMVDTRCKFYKVNEDTNKNLVLRSLLAGHSAGTIAELEGNKDKDWSETKKLLKLTVDGTSEKPWMNILEQLNSLKVSECASLSDYFRQFATKAAELGSKVNVEVQIQAFISGLPTSVANYCKTQNCTNLMDVYEKATILAHFY